MVAVIIAAVVVFISAAAMVPIRIRIGVKMRGLCVNIAITVSYLFGLVGTTVTGKIRLSAAEGLRITQENKKGERKQLFPRETKKKKKRTVFKKVSVHLDKLHLRRIEVSGSFGLENDAYNTVMLTGAADIAVHALFRMLAMRRRSKGCVMKASIEPEFRKNAFRLNLEGILEVFPYQIITAFFRKKEKTGEKENAPDRKHYANLNGAD